MGDEEKMSLQREEKLKLKPDEDSDDDQEPNLDGDRLNMLVLFLLYFLQNIPIGILMSMPLFLQKRGASYEAQAQLSLCRWPIALKLFWAPIVDACYSARFGRIVDCAYAAVGVRFIAGYVVVH